MTRLIDADSIPWLVEGVGEIPVITKEEIDQMPTVDAIPIEFIRSEIKNSKGFYNSSLRRLFDAWAERKEE